MINPQKISEPQEPKSSMASEASIKGIAPGSTGYPDADSPEDSGYSGVHSDYGLSSSNPGNRISGGSGLSFVRKSQPGDVASEQNFLLVSFSLINVLLFAGLTHAGVIAEQSRSFLAAGYVSYFLAGITLIFAFKDYILQGLLSIFRGEVSTNSLLSVFLLSAFSGISVLLFQPEALSLITSLAEGLVASLFLVYLYESVVTGFLKKIENLTGFWLLQAPRTFLRYEKKIGDSTLEHEGGKVCEPAFVAEDVVLDKTNASLRSVPPAVLREEDVLFLEAGDVVPADGRILRGKCIVQERKFSGLPAKRYRHTGQSIWAGSTVLSGKVNVELITRCDESVLTTFTSVLDQNIAELARKRQGYFSTSNLLNGFLLFAAACTYLYCSQLSASGVAASGDEIFFVRLRAFLAALAVLSLAPLSAVLAIVSRAPELLITSLFMKGILVVNNSILPVLSSIKQLVMHFHPEDKDGRAHIRSFEILDQKFEKKGILEALSCLLSVSDHYVDKAVVDYAADELCAGALHEVSDVQVLPGYGVLGLVDGVDISVGTEGFLVERGIYIQPSDLFIEVKKNESAVYVAIYDQVVARILIGEPLNRDASLLREGLKGRKRRLLLCSDSEDREAVDFFGKSIGLDLAEISSGLDEKSYLRKLDMLADVSRGGAMKSGTRLALYSPVPAPSNVKEKLDLSISRFDELKWELQNADMYLMGDNLQRLDGALALADSSQFVTRTLSVFGAVLGIALFAGAITASIPPLMTLLSAVLGVIFTVLLGLRILPRA